MQKIHMMTGLPASGKTTLARKLLTDSDSSMVRVNLDDIRAMMGDGSWSKEFENNVLRMQDELIRRALKDGLDVVVDNTHLTQRIPHRIKAVAAGQAKFIVHDLTHVPMEVCIERDAVREKSVGEGVIRKLNASYKRSTERGWALTEEWLNDWTFPKPYMAASGSLPAVVCDIDGTLALMRGRSPYEFWRCEEDELNPSVFFLVHSLRDALLQVILLSGRDGAYREHTERWLRKFKVPYTHLFMREAGDTRRDDIIKAELFDQHVREKFNVHLVLDDRDRCVNLWRGMGLNTWQVNEGDF